MRWTEMVVYRHPATLQEIVLKSIGRDVSRLIHRLLKEREHPVGLLSVFGNRWRKQTPQLGDLHKYLYDSLPPQLCNLLCSEMLQVYRKFLVEENQRKSPTITFEQAYGNFILSDPSVKDNSLYLDPKWGLRGEILDTLLHPALRQLDVSSWPSALAPNFAENLFRLTGLQHLCLHGVQRPQAWGLQESLSRMNSLTSLDLREGGCDTLVSILAEHCPHIRVLRLSWAEAVTDRCIPALLRLGSLRRLDVVETGISQVGVTTLLRKLPKLQELTVGVDVPLEAILLSIPEQQLSLHHIKLVEPRELDKVISKLPDLRRVELVGPHGDLSCLSELRHLEELSLDLSTLADDEDNPIELVSMARSHRLRRLLLTGSDNVDLPALAATCKHLNSLHTVHCSFLPPAQTRDGAHVAEFCQLEELCVSSVRQSQVWLLLEQVLQGNAASTLRRLAIDTSMSSSAGSHRLANLLLARPLPSLEELSLRGRILLTASTLRQIVRTNAGSLRRIGRAEFWERVTGEDLRLLREDLQSHNNLLVVF